MKKIVFSISLLLLVSCNNDEHSNSTKIDKSLLIGEWVSPNSLNNQFIDLELSNSSWAQYTIISDDIGSNSVIEKDEGVWTWHDNNNGLSVTTTKYSLPNCQVIELSEDSLIMRNLGFNTIEKFYRVVESIELYAGASAMIKYLSDHSDFSLQQTESYNEEIATVSNDGVIEGKQGGVTYVQIKDGYKSLFVKVSVISRIDRFADLTQLSIQQIKELFGEPDSNHIDEFDSIDDFGQETKFATCYYENPDFDPELSRVVCYYHLYEPKIAYIRPYYLSDDAFASDTMYIKKFYRHFQLNYVSNSYAKEKNFYDNSCVVNFYSDDKSMLFENRNSNWFMN